jgi:hypothetical protein
LKVNELDKSWANRYDSAAMALNLTEEVFRPRRLDIAGVASSILATPTIENPVRPGAWRGFCLPGSDGRPSLAHDFSGQTLGMHLPGEPSEIPIRSCIADQLVQSAIRKGLEHRAQKWEPVLRLKGCDNKKLERATCVRLNAARSSMFAPAFEGAGWWPAGRRGGRRAAGKPESRKPHLTANEIQNMTFGRVSSGWKTGITSQRQSTVIPH